MQTMVYQLATALEAQASGSPGPNDVFYTSFIKYVSIPSTPIQILLSSNPDGTGDTFVDDQIQIFVASQGNTEIIYTYDYSNGNSGVITPISPVSMLYQFNSYFGQTVAITTTFTDLFPYSRSGSNFYLFISY